jgi:hypothetical protein
LRYPTDSRAYPISYHHQLGASDSESLTMEQLDDTFTLFPILTSPI